MKRSILIIAMSLGLGSAALAEQSVLYGTWKRGDGNATVRIAPCGNNVCATNVWIGDTSKGEEVGDKLIMSIKGESANRFSGKAKDPKRGLTYGITLNASAQRLTTRGCIIGGILCKEVRWTAAKN